MKVPSPSSGDKSRNYFKYITVNISSNLTVSNEFIFLGTKFGTCVRTCARERMQEYMYVFACVISTCLFKCKYRKSSIIIEYTANGHFLASVVLGV